MAEDRSSAYLPALAFTPADVAANRRGELTVDQQIRLGEIAAVRRRAAMSTAKWLVLGTGGLLVVGFVIEADGDGASGALGAAIALGAMGVFYGVAIAVSYRMALSRPARNGSVRAAEGTAATTVVERRTRYSGSYLTHELHLHGGTGPTEFLLADQASLDQFGPGKRYRVYFLPERPWPIVLSAEPVAGPPGLAGPAVP